jgi:hypothetical protein
LFNLEITPANGSASLAVLARRLDRLPPRSSGFGPFDGFDSWGFFRLFNGIC